MVKRVSHKETASLLSSGSLTCVQLVSECLAQIEVGNHINAFLETWADEALSRASQIDQKVKAGTAGRLAGMVVGIKDNICYKDHVVSASSKILEGLTSIYNATVIDRLLAEDAILIGRLNCDEFAMGSSNENSAYGTVKNPLDNARVPGGSSGGSAAAVAAGMCHAALGSDTGGSIRQPSSFCGTVGLKPTYGRISRYGLIAYASSFDQIGPVTNSVYDAALLLEVMAGADNFDSTASQKELARYSEFNNCNKKYKIAVLRECVFNDGLDSDIKQTTLNFIEKLKNEGHQVEEVSFPLLDYLIPTYYVLTTAEASSNLARFDGAHFGYRSKNAFDLDSTYTMSRSEGFGREVKRRIMLGTFVLSSGYYDAYYTRGLKARRLIKQATESILADFDFILTPTTPTTAFKFGEKGADPVAMYLEDIFTVQANLSGNPSISLPIGKHSNGLPFGLQFTGRNFAEDELLSFAESIKI
ncbi:MAG: Asp-tRNA(Asn)/Glu-tRNA(Gln) amidotransferase subunit GatA [Flavobacteriales bacterium]